jgi:hypothetical protein
MQAANVFIIGISRHFKKILMFIPSLLFSKHTMDLLHNNVDCTNMQFLDWDKNDEKNNEYTMQIDILSCVEESK